MSHSHSYGFMLRQLGLDSCFPMEDISLYLHVVTMLMPSLAKTKKTIDSATGMKLHERPNGRLFFWECTTNAECYIPRKLNQRPAANKVWSNRLTCVFSLFDDDRSLQKCGREQASDVSSSIELLQHAACEANNRRFLFFEGQQKSY